MVSMRRAADAVEIGSIEWGIDAAVPEGTPFWPNSMLLLMPSCRPVEASFDSWKNQGDNRRSPSPEFMRNKLRAEAK
jgi:hypothetical protein